MLKSFYFSQISASDQDRYYNQIMYSILPGDDGASFVINATTGLITTAAQLDREIKDKYVLTVQAEDSKLKYFILIGMNKRLAGPLGRTV